MMAVFVSTQKASSQPFTAHCGPMGSVIQQPQHPTPLGWRLLFHELLTVPLLLWLPLRHYRAEPQKPTLPGQSSHSLTGAAASSQAGDVGFTPHPFLHPALYKALAPSLQLYLVYAAPSTCCRFCKPKDTKLFLCGRLQNCHTKQDSVHLQIQADPKCSPSPRSFPDFTVT